MTGLNPEMRFGKHFLVCAPLNVAVNWEDPDLNPHMDFDNQPNIDRAIEQWAKFIGLLRYHKVRVSMLETHEGLGDQAYTANLFWGMDAVYVMANMSVPSRRPEVKIAARWLVDHGYSVYFLKNMVDGQIPKFEGKANITTTATEHFLCYGIRNSRDVIDEINAIFRLKKPVKPLQLVSKEFYDGDLPIRYFPHKDGIMFFPDAFAGWSVDEIRKSRPREMIKEVAYDFAIQKLGNLGKNFALNGIYFNDVVTFPWSVEAEEFPRDILEWVKTPDITVELYNFSEHGKLGAGHNCSIAVLS